MQAVYYPSLVPNNRYTITQLAILFDKVVIPGAHIPLETLDKKELLERIKHIEKVNRERNESSPEMLLPMYFALEFGELNNIFVSTGSYGHAGILEPEALELAKQIEEAYFGPPKPGFFPIVSGGFAFDVGSSGGINGPATFTYPANAYIYALKHNLPLISDSNLMPFPNNIPHNSNAEYLASQLALASLGLILPKIKPLKADQILEVRTKLKSEIGELHTTMLSYTGRLRKLVGEAPSLDELQRESLFIAQSEVLPAIEHLRKTVESPGGVIRRNLLDLSIENPELILKAVLQPENLQNWLDILNVTGKQLKKTVGEIRDHSRAVNSSGLALLLKLPVQYR